MADIETDAPVIRRFMNRLAVTAGSVAALVVMVAIECYIRGRILRRRNNPNPPAARPQAGAHRA